MRCLLNLLLVLGIAGLLAADGTSLWAQAPGKGSAEGPKSATVQPRARFRGGFFSRILKVKRRKVGKSPPHEAPLKLKAVSSSEPKPKPKPPAVSPGNPRSTQRSRVTLELPERYHDQDADRDGQIGLYEWPRGKFAEFFTLDRNSDGFLTPRELNRAAGAESRLAENAE